MPRKTSITREEFNERYVVLKADGMSDVAIARELSISPMTVLRWKKDLTNLEPSDVIEANPVAAHINRTDSRDHVRQIRELQEENELLKRILSNHLIDAVLAEERLKRKS